MLLDDLQAAIGPAVALLLVGFERVGQETMTIPSIGVMDLPPVLEHMQTEIAILDNGVTRPASGCDERLRDGSGTSCRAR